MISLIFGILKNDKNELIYKNRNIFIDIEDKLTVTKGESGGGRDAHLCPPLWGHWLRAERQLSGNLRSRRQGHSVQRYQGLGLNLSPPSAGPTTGCSCSQPPTHPKF